MKEHPCFHCELVTRIADRIALGDCPTRLMANLAQVLAEWVAGEDEDNRDELLAAAHTKLDQFFAETVAERDGQDPAPEGETVH